LTEYESDDTSHLDDEKIKAKIGIIKGIDQITMRETLQKHGVI
jgi:hypothetical protein